jgi:two-component system, chemotaxis family, sensor kinase CheA
MDVVRSTVRALNGELTLATERGRGTRFTVDLPLTLMIVDALLVRVGGQTMAVPQPVLREVLKVEGNAATRMGDGEIIPYRGGVLPLVRLTRVFGLPPERDEASSFHVLVVGDDGDRIGLAVEGLAGLREIVVHPVDDPLVATLGVGGATELTDGRLGLILDAAALTRDLRGRKGAGRLTREALPGMA